MQERERRQALADFLRWRRTSLSPTAVGLPSRVRRSSAKQVPREPSATARSQNGRALSGSPMRSIKAACSTWNRSTSVSSHTNGYAAS